MDKVGLVSLEHQTLRGDLREVYKIMKGIGWVDSIFPMCKCQRLNGIPLRWEEQNLKEMCRASFSTWRMGVSRCQEWWWRQIFSTIKDAFGEPHGYAELGKIWILCRRRIFGIMFDTDNCSMYLPKIELQRPIFNQNLFSWKAKNLGGDGKVGINPCPKLLHL